jgi:SsrA-binding protein
MAEKIIAVNRKARHSYSIESTFEAGLVLVGTEVKSLREGKANLKDSYGRFKGGELYLVNAHISEYRFGNRGNHDPIRDRKLLLKKRELRKLIGKVSEKGKTLVPLKLYFKGGIAKVEMAVASGKKLFDKREDLKKRDANREMARAIKHRV